MKSPKKSLFISFITQYAELVIQFIGVLALARILSPEEIGVYSVAAFFMTLLHVFRDFGVARYIIQEEELTVDKIRSAFGVAIILASAVAVVLLTSSSLVAALYLQPQVEEILVIMSASFAITPIGSVLTAIFRREMQFKKIFIVRVSSALCHVTVAITLALDDFGALSLAWANFAGILTFGIAANLMRSPTTPWIPHFKNIQKILSFGSIASAGTVASVASSNAPDVIIGKAINLAAAGYFSRANGLIQLFRTLVTGAVMPLILPYFAQIRRDKDDLTKPYHLAVEHLTVLAWPFYAVLALLALPVVRTLYGPQWDASVPVVQILCIAGAISSIGAFGGEVMVANGHIRNVTLVQLIVSAARIIAILLASTNGLLAVGIAIVISECISLIVISHFLSKTVGVNFLGVLKATRKSAIVTAASVVPAAIMVAWIDESTNTWLPLIAGFVGALSGWVTALLCTGHPMRKHLHNLFGLVVRTEHKPATGD